MKRHKHSKIKLQNFPRWHSYKHSNQTSVERESTIHLQAFSNMSSNDNNTDLSTSFNSIMMPSHPQLLHKTTRQTNSNCQPHKSSRNNLFTPPNAMPSFVNYCLLVIILTIIISSDLAPVALANSFTNLPQSFDRLANSNQDYTVRNNPINDDQHSHQVIDTTKLVKLGNTTHSNVRGSHRNQKFRQSTNNDQPSIDLITNKSSDSNQLTKGLTDKVCIGTSNRMSVPKNQTDHYQNLVERYTNCTYVIGNLEITWLENGPDNRPPDLDFLENIREITGYLLIAYVKIERIRMPNLQIIRGRDLYGVKKSDPAELEEMALFAFKNELKSLELPNLREIIAGSVGFYSNNNLCYVRSIQWDEILNTQDNSTFKSIFLYDGVEPICPRCDCPHAACWGDGPEMCQKFSKKDCPAQCSGGRCFGQGPRDCCHLFCAGGCHGPKSTDCFACKNFNNDGECIAECPSMQRYNPSAFSWEPNPSGRFAYGATCVKRCPDHLLRDNGACVRHCPPNKQIIKNECIQCSGPCPKNCQGVHTVHSDNIDQLVNCTVIEGSITILDTSFEGYVEFHANNTMGQKHEPMHPDRLEVFKTVREITGYLNIQASHPDFKNLSYFRNLQLIAGRQTTDTMHVLSILRTSLVSLNLRSLKQTGAVMIEENRDLCFANKIDWKKIAPNARDNDVIIRSNADERKCQEQGHKCHSQCGNDGCWGSGQNECLSCRQYKLEDYCVERCSDSIRDRGFLSYDAGNRTCMKCHSECKSGCYGTGANQCIECKNFQDGPFCVEKCPEFKYSKNGLCVDCDKSCAGGCTGPSSKPGKGGCNSCQKLVINSTSPTLVAQCIQAHEKCPDGHFEENDRFTPDGQKNTTQLICRKCHHRCKSCTSLGTHIAVCKCAKYVAGEQCEDFCPRDYYADERSMHCFHCSSECNGCTGPTDADCLACRVYRVYPDTFIPGASLQDMSIHKQQVRFNCTSQCPSDKPYRISEANMVDPYCSETPGPDYDNPRIMPIGSTSTYFLIILFVTASSCFVLYRCQKRKDTKIKLTMRLSGFDDVEPLNQSNVKPNLAPLRSIKETELRKGRMLGSGFGGKVYMGMWYPEGQDNKQPRPVAIKVLRDDNGQSNMHKEFLEEAYIMASVNHPNLVRLLAVCMTPKQLMLVTQLMPLGCLLDYVKKHKNEIGSKNLLEWCKQIAKGMAYLEEHRMVHRDLALRNVLLQTSGRALISDFGLAKLLELDQSEYHSGGGRLPIKWLAPECISQRKFTHKSDVWAFGVTIWELLSFGLKPFDDYDTKDVPMAIEKGARLQQPKHVSAEVYKVMYACWFYNPEDRPSFKGLCENFVCFARDPERYLVIGSKGIDYGACREVCRNSDSDENAFDDYGSDMNSQSDETSQPRSALPDLMGVSQTNGDMFGFELRHHSESEAGQNGQHISTPTFKKNGVFTSAGQQLIEENIFSNNFQQSRRPSGSPTTDGNNNFLSSGRLTMNADSCGSVHHTVSTNSIGQKSEQPTDLDDYLLPSPCSNEEKFTKFLANHEVSNPKLHQGPSYPRDPPHSAGLIGISNEEYFLTRINYANPNGAHSSTNASISHMPQSLV